MVRAFALALQLTNLADPRLLGRYEWREPTFNSPTLSSSHHARFPPESGQLNTQTYLSPIVKTCNDVQSTYLKTADPQLWKSMQAAGIEPQIYGMCGQSNILGRLRC